MFWFEDKENIKKTAFTFEQCHDNAKTIEELLGSDWLKKQSKYPQPYRHPIARNWEQNGIGIVLDFSILALDLKTLKGCQGFEILLNDLKTAKKYSASRHEAHIASFFKKGNVSNLSLSQDTKGKNPDFHFTANNEDFYVECKTFEKSNTHVRFSNMIESILDAVRDKMNENNKFCAVEIEFLEPFYKVDLREILNLAERFLDEYEEKELIHRKSSFSIRIHDTPMAARNWDYKESYYLYIKSPIDPNETTRVRRTIADARNSLPADGINIICIELPHFSFVYPTQVIQP